MKIFAIFLVFTLLAMSAMAQVPYCRPVGVACETSKQCCGFYCRSGRCSEYGTNPGEEGKTNPCFSTTCLSGSQCYLKECSRRCTGAVACIPN